jgi:hypothetical protein
VPDVAADRRRCRAAGGLAATVVSVVDGAGDPAPDPSGSSAEVQRAAVLIAGERAGRAVTGEPPRGFRVQPDAVGRGDPVGGLVVVAGELLAGGVQHELVTLPLAHGGGVTLAVEEAGGDLDKRVDRTRRTGRHRRFRGSVVSSGRRRFRPVFDTSNAESIELLTPRRTTT